MGKKQKQKITISVIGRREINAQEEKLAFAVGRIVARCGAVLVCGGLTGAMAASAAGAKSAGGLTIGLLPGILKADANPFIDIALPTTIGFARNAMVACSGDAVIALPGTHGTSCEISYSFVYKRPVFDLGNWNVPGMIKVKNLRDLELKLKSLIRSL